LSDTVSIARIDQNHTEQAQGTVIVIDVIRAFSVASYAFAGGARAMWLVRTPEEALTLRQRDTSALLGGEVGGRLIPGFDFNNSPSQMAQRDVRGKLLIQRTGAGTQGAVAVASQATLILLCALTNAWATATYAQRSAMTLQQPITLFPTAHTTDSYQRNEDIVCADYLEELLRAQHDAKALLDQGMQQIRLTRFQPWLANDPDFPSEDIEAVLAPDRFDFVMVGTRKEWQGITYVEVQRVEL
jgi:2-phosphosulfolactate phosphatase